MKQRIFGIFFFGFILSISGCERKPDAIVSDDHSGKTVRSFDDVEKIILTRFENAPIASEKAPLGKIFDSTSGDAVNIQKLWSRKPAVLVFGSSSCTSVNGATQEFNMLIERFGTHVDFNYIYIREAHPLDGYQPILKGDLNTLGLPPIIDPATIQARCSTAGELADRLKLDFHFYSDGLDDQMAVLWGAWPSRIFVVDTNGVVIYGGGQAPWYFQPTRKYTHYPPPENLGAPLQTRNFDKISLEEFLENRFP